MFSDNTSLAFKSLWLPAIIARWLLRAVFFGCCEKGILGFMNGGLSKHLKSKKRVNFHQLPSSF
jgi:hypothetical protein